MRLNWLLLLALSCFIVACEKAPEVEISSASMEMIRRGVELMPTYCHTCHGVGDFAIDEMLAPPLWAVRANYLAKYPEPEAFVEAMAAFITEPTVAESLMPSEVLRYGLKAPVSLSKEEIRAVAWAIYAGRVERPVWLREYQKRHRKSNAI
ncbi:MAG: hypothetical protein ACPGSB_06695 [Opitutales bacterium]